MTATINLVSLVYVKNNCLMLCRKRGLPYLIQPGGKAESGESPLTTVQREVMEELGVVLENPRYLTTWRGLPTGPEYDFLLNMIAYEGTVDETNIVCKAEIENYTWYPLFTKDPSAYAPLAPSLKETIIPYLQHRYR